MKKILLTLMLISNINCFAGNMQSLQNQVVAQTNISRGVLYTVSICGNRTEVGYGRGTLCAASIAGTVSECIVTLGAICPSLVVETCATCGISVNDMWLWLNDCEQGKSVSELVQWLQ